VKMKSSVYKVLRTGTSMHVAFNVKSVVVIVK
jgi:hypothetical protein